MQSRVCLGQKNNGIEFISSFDLTLLRRVNKGENGQLDLLLQNLAGATIAHLTSWENGTKEEGIIQLLCSDMEQNAMDEITINGLIALSEENRRKRSWVSLGRDRERL